MITLGNFIFNTVYTYYIKENVYFSEWIQTVELSGNLFQMLFNYYSIQENVS